MLGAILSGAELSVKAGQNVMLTWSASTNTDVVGYNVYFGTQSQTYTNEVQVGNVTNAVFTNLTPGATYYFSAKSYDSAANESAFADETVFTIALPAVIVTNLPPTLKGLANMTINRNSNTQKINLTGITAGITNGMPLTVTATSSNPNLINPTVNYTSPKPTGTLTFKPAANATGTAIITVTVNNGGTNNNTFSQTFTVTVVTPVTKAMVAQVQVPKITHQPQSVAVSFGKAAILTVGVSGKAPFHYQWKYNGTNLPGATASFLYLQNVTTAQSGLYSVQISNDYGATNSVSAVVGVPVTPAVNLTSSKAVTASSTTSTSATLTTASGSGRGHFSFQVNSTSGGNYVVEASSDLNTWVSVYTNQVPFVYTDSNPTAYTQRFYRAVSLQ